VFPPWSVVVPSVLVLQDSTEEEWFLSSQVAEQELAGVDTSPRCKQDLMHAWRKEVVRERKSAESIATSIQIGQQKKAKHEEDAIEVPAKSERARAPVRESERKRKKARDHK
jgi:hypothetical protein